MRHGIKALPDPPVPAAAGVYINGKRAGSLWHHPYRLDVTALLHLGSNTLEVKVANTAINPLSGEDRPK
ncbi:MAG: glycosylhydrolase-like jelly roll fold domain-containing protein [Acidobacteriaceae bacterium]